jgi:hypothetical protein
MESWVQTGIGVVMGCLLSFGFSWYWGCDPGEARAKNDRLLQHQVETIQTLRGFLLGVRLWATVDVKQVDDRLQYIKEQGEKFARIEKGE